MRLANLHRSLEGVAEPTPRELIARQALGSAGLLPLLTLPFWRRKHLPAAEEAPLDIPAPRQATTSETAQHFTSILDNIDFDGPLAIEAMYRHELADGTVYLAPHDELGWD